MNEQTKPELGINFSDLPPGSYIVKDGKLLPNLNDEAMALRAKSKAQKNVTLSEVEGSGFDVLSSDKEEIKKD